MWSRVWGWGGRGAGLSLSNLTPHSICPDSHLFYFRFVSGRVPRERPTFEEAGTLGKVTISRLLLQTLLIFKCKSLYYFADLFMVVIRFKVNPDLAFTQRPGYISHSCKLFAFVSHITTVQLELCLSSYSWIGITLCGNGCYVILR